MTNLVPGEPSVVSDHDGSVDHHVHVDIALGGELVVLELGPQLAGLGAVLGGAELGVQGQLHALHHLKNKETKMQLAVTD